MYHEGQGVPQDYKEAIKYFRLSAEQGNADAQMVLDALIKKQIEMRCLIFSIVLLLASPVHLGMDVISLLINNIIF